MRSRAFRNSIDAAITKRALGMLGVRIISSKEDFGTEPAATPWRPYRTPLTSYRYARTGRTSSRSSGTKALNGGTISRAKLGYLNIRVEHEGRLFSSIGLDKRRAPLVRKAFELYASGDYSIDRLEAAMADLGLTTPDLPAVGRKSYRCHQVFMNGPSYRPNKAPGRVVPTGNTSTT